MNTTREPIHIDPLLAEVFELLHRMTLSEDKILAWHARDAIRVLSQYEKQERNKNRSM